MEYLWVIDIFHELFAYIGNDNRFSSDRVCDCLALLLRLILVRYHFTVLSRGLILSINLLVSGSLVLIKLAYELLDVGNTVGTAPWFVGLLSWRWMRHGEVLWKGVLAARLALPLSPSLNADQCSRKVRRVQWRERGAD